MIEDDKSYDYLHFINKLSKYSDDYENIKKLYKERDPISIEKKIKKLANEIENTRISLKFHISEFIDAQEKEQQYIRPIELIDDCIIEKDIIIKSRGEIYDDFQKGIIKKYNDLEKNINADLKYYQKKNRYSMYNILQIIKIIILPLGIIFIFYLVTQFIYGGLSYLREVMGASSIKEVLGLLFFVAVLVYFYWNFIRDNKD